MDKLVFGMAGLRFLSATIEFSAAMLMLYFGRVESALQINSLLVLVGPTIFTLVTALGICGIAGKVSPTGLGMILTGVALIFMGVRKL